MKRLTRSTLVGLLLTAGGLSSGSAVQLMRWERLTLAVPLVVGQERVVFVDRGMRVRVPPGVGDRLRVQSAGGALYLRASAPVPPTRLELQDVDSGQLILIDVAAQAAKKGQAPLEPIRLVEAGSAIAAAEDGDRGASLSVSPHETPEAVTLTRYAAQSLYAPLRTVEAEAGIARVSLHRDLALDTLLPALPLRLRALAAWRLGDEWVTAVQLANTSDHDVSLDPRALQGDFVAATFQHPTLGPAGRSSDTTVVYLVTRGHGLAESLLPAVAPVDPAVNLPPRAAAGQVAGYPGDEK